jgi:glycosyltransferase involved in cell wall biosynthesis
MQEFDVSVIVPSVNSYSDLKDCLQALKAQQDARVEIIVVDRLGFELVAAVKRDFSDIVVIPTAADATIPEMRAVGIRRAHAPAVAVIEDHVMVRPFWARQLLDALAEGHDVVGGTVENAATEKLVDWAAFLCEYSAVLPPLPSGPSDWLPGNNVIYRREILKKFDAVLDEGKWENRLHDAMHADGITLIMRPDIVADHKMHYTFGLYMEQRYLYSRSYAGARIKDAPMSRRLMMGAAAFALPPLVFIRVVKNIVSKRKHLGYLIKSLPMLVAFAGSWGAGEIVGYWFGGGNALSKVR